VTHDVPPYAIVAGNPARVLRYCFDKETIKKLEDTEWWNLNLDELKKIAPKLQEIVLSK
jgi:serine acetyltransferase